MPNTVRDNEMTIPDRLTKMENQIRGFVIVVTGPGFIEGGFGPLPQSNDTSERIQNISQSIDQFRLVGDGVNVDGSFDLGYSIS